MTASIRDILKRARTWPRTAQDRLAAAALRIESELALPYHATADELAAIDDAEISGVASDAAVAAAFVALKDA